MATSPWCWDSDYQAWVRHAADIIMRVKNERRPGEPGVRWWLMSASGRRLGTENSSGYAPTVARAKAAATGAARQAGVRRAGLSSATPRRRPPAAAFPSRAACARRQA